MIFWNFVVMAIILPENKNGNSEIDLFEEYSWRLKIKAKKNVHKGIYF